MKLTEIKIIKIWESAAEKLNGKFSMSFQKVNGGMIDGGIYLLRIDKEYFNLSIQIHAGLGELGLKKNEYENCEITITATKKTIDNIELSIWRKDFMDRLLSSGKSNTGYKEFDKVIGLKASKNIEKHLHKIFANERLRNEFIEDNYRAYNVHSKDNIVSVQRKSSLRMGNSDMILNEFERFTRLLDGFIITGIL